MGSFAIFWGFGVILAISFVNFSAVGQFTMDVVERLAAPIRGRLCNRGVRKYLY
jgi:hypothetical protein